MTFIIPKVSIFFTIADVVFLIDSVNLSHSPEALRAHTVIATSPTTTPAGPRAAKDRALSDVTRAATPISSVPPIAKNGMSILNEEMSPPNTKSTGPAATTIKPRVLINSFEPSSKLLNHFIDSTIPSIIGSTVSSRKSFRIGINSFPSVIAISLKRPLMTTNCLAKVLYRSSASFVSAVFSSHALRPKSMLFLSTSPATAAESNALCTLTSARPMSFNTPKTSSPASAILPKPSTNTTKAFAASSSNAALNSSEVIPAISAKSSSSFPAPFTALATSIMIFDIAVPPASA